MSNILGNLARWKPFTALVIGDFMLDQYVYGAAERLSPDAPVPVLQASRIEDRAGGAANVAACLQSLDAQVYCFGVIGIDSEGTVLSDAIAASGADVCGLIKDSDRTTTIKRSLIGLAQHRHPQKMFRVDMESREPIDQAVCKKILTAIEEALPKADVVCIEDYNKGVCNESLLAPVIKKCKQAGIPVLVDPAAIADYARYQGATAVTPNRSEAELATGRSTPLEASEKHNGELARQLMETVECEVVVVTLDRHGALLLERGQSPKLMPTQARSVYDVTGAGDMVIAALAGAVANEFTWEQAVALSNMAAGLEVERFGAQPIAISELRRAALQTASKLVGKIRDRMALEVEVQVHREAGHRIVLTNGCFDILHAGHVAYLQQAKGEGDVLVVGVNADEQVRALKGQGRPVFTAEQRMRVLAALECVDYVTEFQEPTAEALIRSVMPNIYAKGGDYQPEQIAEHAFVAELGIELRVLAHEPGLGSTQILDHLETTKPQ